MFTFFLLKYSCEKLIITCEIHVIFFTREGIFVKMKKMCYENNAITIVQFHKSNMSCTLRFY